MGKPLVPIALGIVFAAIAAFMTLGYLKNASQAPVEIGMATESVVVSTQDIDRGEVLNLEHIKVIDWPKSAVPQNVYGSIEEAVGQIARVPIYANDPITHSKVIDSGSRSILSMLIPPGRRAMSIKVNEVTGIAGFIAPGSRIDVLLSIGGHGDDDPRTRIVLQDIEVLAIAQNVEQRDSKPTVVSTVTLNLRPRESEALTLAGNEGSLQLVLRNDKDQGRIHTTGVSLEQVMGGNSVTGAGPQVELIRGVDREMLTF